MLNFNKKKYVSFDNLGKFSGMIQKAMSDKLGRIESGLKQMVDSRFQALTSKEQGDSEVIDAREGKLSLLENLRTFVKKDVYESERDDVRLKLDDVKSTSDLNKEYINTNKSAIARAIEFVDMFRVEVSPGNTGYLKLPSVLGGIMFQWGKFDFEITKDARDEYYDFTYLKPFDYDVFYCGCQCINMAWLHTCVTGGSEISSRVWVVNLDDSPIPKTPIYMRWFAIGR